MADGHCPELPKDTLCHSHTGPSQQLSVTPWPAGGLLDPTCGKQLWLVRPKPDSCYIFLFLTIPYPSLRFGTLKACWFLLLKYFFFQINWFVRGPWTTRGSWCDNSWRHSRDQWYWRWQTVGCRWGIDNAFPGDYADNHQGATSSQLPIASQPSQPPGVEVPVLLASFYP